MDIKKLRQKWERESAFYKKQEVGTGVQSFVREFLENDELLNLREGHLSSKLESRHREYIQEKTAKEGRKADFAIYIDSDVVIPLEAECYGNIKNGVQQIFNYQKDFEKHYGILTDGYTWRFYNNNVYREFSLSQIFDETEIFLEFWKGYIKPEFYYLSFFEPQGQLALFKEADTLHVEKNKQLFFEDITQLIKSFKNKLQVEGYFVDLEKKEREKKAVEITYAYIIQFILYKTLVDNMFGQFAQEFTETVEAIHECLKAKQYGKVLTVTEGISNKISKNIYRPFKKEQDFINQLLLELIRKPKNELHEVAPWLDIFVFVKKYNFANIQNEIFGYIYENYLKVLYEDEQKGQYFTDPAIVNFMLQQVGFTPETIKKRYEADKNSVSLVDPSCGSGTFLYSAVNEIIKAFGDHSIDKSKQIEAIVNDNIFGLDIAEFPLYLAEMSILMRMLPLILNESYKNPIDKKIKIFWSRDSIAEFSDAGLKNTVNDIEVASGQQPLFVTNKLDFGFDSYMREKSDIEDMKRSMRPPRKRFDFVIGNPPYVGYNECSSQKVLFFELMKQSRARLNDVYGVNLHSVPGNQKKNAPKPNLYAFFIALGLSLLKDNGKLCYIIPQTILNAGHLDVLRYHLAKFTTIEKIITFSGKLFVGRGLKQNKPVATSSLIFVVNRRTSDLTNKVEVINYLDANDDVEKILENISVGKKMRKKTIPQNAFLQNVNNWNFIKHDKKILKFYEEYKRKSDDISVYYNHIEASHQFSSKFYFDIGYDINERLLDTETISHGYQYPKIDEAYMGIKFIKGYWPNDREVNSKFRIKLLTTNQGYNLIDSPSKIIWSYINPKKFHFTSLPLIWARNQICAIGSTNKRELLYLFSVLNSPVNHKVLTSLLKTDNEKDLLISITSLKGFVRIPIISEDNRAIKNEIIEQAEQILILEDKMLPDFVDFSEVMIQKFDTVLVDNNLLVLKRNDEKIELPIKRGTILIEKAIKEKFDDKKLNFQSREITLSELKSLPIIDFERQRAIKYYLDDLVFALYFDIRLEIPELGKAETIKANCSKNQFYQLVNEER